MVWPAPGTPAWAKTTCCVTGLDNDNARTARGVALNGRVRKRGTKPDNGAVVRDTPFSCNMTLYHLPYTCSVSGRNAWPTPRAHAYAPPYSSATPLAPRPYLPPPATYPSTFTCGPTAFFSFAAAICRRLSPHRSHAPTTPHTIPHRYRFCPRTMPRCLFWCRNSFAVPAYIFAPRSALPSPPPTPIASFCHCSIYALLATDFLYTLPSRCHHLPGCRML